MTEHEQDHQLTEVMIKLETALESVPLDHLRIRVNQGDRRSFPPGMRLPTGNTFENHQKQARLWLDFIDDWAALRKEAKDNISEARG